MKLKKLLRRILLSAGFALLAFCLVAKLHELILSHAATRRFEDLKQETFNVRMQKKPFAQPVASAPSFVLWSQQRIRHYEESLSKRVATPLAIIRINRIGLEAPVLEGTDDLTLNRGVGHIAGTAAFGETGNVGIAGHRDGFFRGLKDIKVGDHIEVEETDRVETYVVDSLEIVTPKDIGVLRSTNKPALTLVTCYPFYYIGDAPRRFIVHATLFD